MLKLKQCVQKSVQYNPDTDETHEVEIFTKKYKEVSAMAAANGDPASQGGIGKADLTTGALGMAIYAQIRSLHPLLISDKDRARLLKGSGNMDSDYQDGVEPSSGPESDYNDDNWDDTMDTATRANWLTTIKETPDLLTGSPRTQCFLRLFKWLRLQHPDRKIVVFSNFLKYLDIVDEVLRRELAIVPVRYDGSVSVSQRPAVEDAFKTCTPDIPLLITGGAGKLPYVHIRCAC